MRLARKGFLPTKASIVPGAFHALRKQRSNFARLLGVFGVDCQRGPIKPAQEGCRCLVEGVIAKLDDGFDEPCHRFIMWQRDGENAHEVKKVAIPVPRQIIVVPIIVVSWAVRVNRPCQEMICERDEPWRYFARGKKDKMTD